MSSLHSGNSYILLHSLHCMCLFIMLNLLKVGAPAGLPAALDCSSAQRVIVSFMWLCRLTVQLARTEEAARRAVMRSDPEARGDTAKLLMDLQAELSRALAERTSLQSRLTS